MLSVLEVMTLFECHLHLSSAFVIYLWASHAVSIHLPGRHRIPNSPLSFWYWNERNDIFFYFLYIRRLFYSLSHPRHNMHRPYPCTMYIHTTAQHFFFVLNSFHNISFCLFLFMDFILRSVLFVLKTSSFDKQREIQLNDFSFRSYLTGTHYESTNQWILSRWWRLAYHK